jgi:hypothetical protein
MYVKFAYLRSIYIYLYIFEERLATKILIIITVRTSKSLLFILNKYCSLL